MNKSRTYEQGVSGLNRAPAPFRVPASIAPRTERRPYRRVGAGNCSPAPLTEPDERTRIRLFGSVYQSASKSWADADGGLSSCQRSLSEASRPVNQAGE